MLQTEPCNPVEVPMPHYERLARAIEELRYVSVELDRLIADIQRHPVDNSKEPVPTEQPSLLEVLNVGSDTLDGLRNDMLQRVDHLRELLL